VRLPEGEVFLACLLDVYSRKCIGWSLSRRIDAQLPLQAAFDGLSTTGGPS
jgi:putative transposase